MLFMNEWDIQEAMRLHARHPVLSKATSLLYALMILADSVSDGWPYWTKPCRAARKLQELIQANHPYTRKRDAPAPTEADLKRAVAPIKAFLKKNRKADWPTLNLPC